LISEIRLKD